MTADDPTPYLREKVTLTNCDTEPIHIPGAIQSHGCLVVNREADFQIVAVSDNLPSFLEASAESAIGMDVRELFSQNGKHELDSQFVASTSESIPYRRFEATINGSACFVSRRLIGELCYWELERNANSDVLEPGQILTTLLRSQNEITIAESYDLVLNEIRSAIGFDRVMLYQFHEDLHGSVIAEKCSPDMESFLGLHYPAADIPLPARRLYERNWIRAIADINSEPSAMLVDPDEPNVQPLDLSDCALRAVSPIHIEYLQNMKVGATLSISIMDGNRLWGMIVCHHNSARHVSPQQRDTCELVGTTLSAYLTSRRQQEYLKTRLSINESLPKKIEVVAGKEHFSNGLSEAVPIFLEVMDADGVAWIDRQRTRCWEQTPGDTILDRIVGELRVNGNSDIAYTDQLSEWLNVDSSATSGCGGMVAICVGRNVDSGVLLIFRRPLAQKINWAGNPEKSVVDEEGRLSPRKSFEKFQQEIINRSRPWSDQDKDTARSLQSSLKTLVADRADLLEQANEKLRQLNVDLDTFAFAASHDLKEPLRGIQFYKSMLESAGTLSDDEYKARLEGLGTIVQRMDHLLDGLLRFSRAGRNELEISEFDLQQAVDDTVASLIYEQEGFTIEVDVEPGGTMRGDVACVREILSNLLTNAIKYNDNDVRRITVGLMDTKETSIPVENGQTAIFVSDNGIGIREKHHNEIFDVFRRLHANDEFGGGSGAGLTIVRRMVERHGGRITLDSSPAGTTFYFTLGDQS